MTEPDRISPHSGSLSTTTINDQRLGAVTAARRHGNLETIRKQSGWEDFPSCVPVSMRTTKSGKVTEFGNTKLRIIERIAISTEFIKALEFLEESTEGGERLISLRDLEQCAAHFDKDRKGRSRERKCSSAPASTVASQEDESEPSYQSTIQPLESWKYFTLNQSPMPLQIETSMQTLKRPSPEAFQSMSVSPVDSKRSRTGSFFEDQQTELLFEMTEHELFNTANLAVPQGYHHQRDTRIPTSPSVFSSQSPAQNPARALLSIHPHAGSIFSNLNTAFDDLLARIEDQQQLVRTALDQSRMATNGLSVTSGTMHTSANRDLETGLRTAQRNEARARHDLEQARSARDVIDVQYGNVGTALSRALVDTVRAEYTRAGVALTRAQADVENARQELSSANNREKTLRRTKEVAEVGIDQLQRQTKFWLERLAAAGVKLTDQLNTLQRSDASQSSSQM
jgi:hypothetical protein